MWVDLGIALYIYIYIIWYHGIYTLSNC
jgi:hypothetical protein